MRVLKFLLTSVLVVGFIIPGCNPDLGCDCSGVLKYFDIQGVTTSFEYANGTSSDTYQWEDIVGKIIYDTEYYGAIEQEEKPLYGFSLIPTASACSCAPDGWSGSEEGLGTLTITTVNDYNANYPAGSEINAITQYYVFETGDYEVYEDFVSRNTQAIFEQLHNFKLTEAPAVSGTPFQLNIKLTLDNGEEYDVTTQEVTLNL